jgi:predicted dehydrogenase
VKVLVVGRGKRGLLWERLVARHRGLRLAGTVDPDPGRGATWRGIGDAALAESDAAIIASPPAVHAECALACLEAGLALLVEKPLALTLTDARAVADAARAAVRPVVVGQNFAQRPLERGVAKALEGSGPLMAGAIVSARAHSATSAQLSGLDHPVLWDFAIHHFDLIRRRAGSAPATVEATRFGETYRVSFRWSSAPEVTWWHDDGGTLFHRAEWWRAEHGAVEVRGERAWHVVEGARPRRLRLPRGSAERRLLDALVRGESDVEVNLGTIAMVTATEAAIETPGVVELEPLPVAS